jgi:hypothetical protein
MESYQKLGKNDYGLPGAEDRRESLTSTPSFPDERVLARDEECRAPVLAVVLGGLEVPPLSRHPDGDVADPAPGVRPRVQETPLLLVRPPRGRSPRRVAGASYRVTVPATGTTKGERVVFTDTSGPPIFYVEYAEKRTVCARAL